MSLAPLRCGSCGAPVPLREAPQVPCVHCGGSAAVPPTYLEAAGSRREASAARRAAEPHWRALGEGSSARTRALGLALVALLPPLATAVAELTSGGSAGRIMAWATLPALLPGAGLWTFSSARAATAKPLRDALAAGQAAGGPPVEAADGAAELAASGGVVEGGERTCRACGAPLDAEPDALAATCLYCGTDSLLTTVAVGAERARLGEAVRSLTEAVQRLRARRAMLALGIGAALALVGLTSGLLGWVVGLLE